MAESHVVFCIETMVEFAESEQPILRVEGLVKIYGPRRVVDGVTFHVNKGEIVGLLGPNGAGKTTSFRMACGLINSNGGTVFLGNQNVTDWSMYRRSRDGGMGYLPQDRSVFQKLSVQNNLYGVMEMLGIKKNDRKLRCDELLEKFNLTHLRHSYGGSLSGGERRRLEIARSLVSRPKIILLDEPFAAIDPVTITSIQEIILILAAEGIAFLITDHSVRETLDITKRSYIIQAGKVLCEGTRDEVLANPEARKGYFGEQEDRFRNDLSPRSDSSPPPPPVLSPGNRKSSRTPERHIDRDWEVPKTSILTDKVPKHEPIDEREIPFHLKFHTPPSSTPFPTESVLLEKAVDPSKPEGQDSEKPSRKRLRPISNSIMRDSEEGPPQDDPGMSSIIRNLGQLIWKK